MASFPNNIAISTSCLGQNPAHKLDDKIRAAAQQGFQGLEIVYADLSSYSRAHNLPILTGAKQIRQLADDLGVVLISLAPFENFEGAKTPLKERLAVAAHWLDLARVLGASYLQLPSQYDADSIGDEAAIASEMQQLADLASSSSPVVSIAYEPLSWGIWYSTWDDALKLTQLVDRDNFGLCLDTFHEITKLWANPFLESGACPDGAEKLAASLRRFVEQVPISKIFYVQLSDAERFNPPFSKSHPWYIEGEPAEFTWSKHARPFPLEREFGGYTPVTDVVRAWIVDSGFKGWVSMEIFDRRMRDEAYAIDTAARRAWKSWEKVQAEFGRQKAKA
ncbi:sugar phosphate isomerase/epimerase family protein [Aspergillus foveolatus]|uniref:sugar phosphate isomerase/epimerase family protein n=1 Tax=Aspergillus foveolatus TaxID=210207 RepID=UPI003CCE41D6